VHITAHSPRIVVWVSTMVLASTASLSAQAPNGAALYQQQCASCHDRGLDRAPSRDVFREMTPERVLAAMESGPMITMAVRLGAPERRAVAEFVTGKAFSEGLAASPKPEAMCSAGSSAFSTSAGPLWNGWGANLSNTRLQNATMAGLTAADVGRLKVRWAFGFPGDMMAYAQPTVAGGRIFVGSQGGKVYALSAATGCVHWFFETAGVVRAAVTIARLEMPSGTRDAALFGDQVGNLYAVDAATGTLLWRTKLDDFPTARVTGSPVFHKGRIYVGLASGEETTAAVADYECCRFRGSLVALNAVTGKQVWKTYMIPEEALPTKKNNVGRQLWGPSGAPIWTTPAIDERRNALYVGTGDNYSDPPSRMSDAFVAMDLDSGKILWSRQMTAADAWNVACRLDDTTNCPESNGPDVDFAASPILVILPNGRRALVAGQKNGVVHALDPDDEGKILWQVRIGVGGTRGGVQWGSAADQSNVYVALSDIGRIKIPNTDNTEADPKRGGGIWALRLSDGQQAWMTPPPGCGEKPRCSPAQSAAVSAIPGVAFSGSIDGHLRAYSTGNGAILWDFDTAVSHPTVNGVPARGGSIDGGGPAIAGGMVFATSGYHNGGGMPGNVLLAFSVDGK
jgi:polyvinyl alcohol dehydrogenase (cytochrome)